MIKMDTSLTFYIGKGPQEFFDSMSTQYGFQLKDVGTQSSHPGKDFFERPYRVQATP